MAKPPLSVPQVAKLLGWEYWRVRNAVDALFAGQCPRVGSARVVPARKLPKILALLEAQDRQIKGERR